MMDADEIQAQAMQRLLGGEDLEPFCDWYAQVLPALDHSGQIAGMASTADLARSYRHVARQLWAHMPIPSNRWRPRGLPKLERNAPCHCGSGRKYKHCCAEFEHSPFELSTETLWTLALEYADPVWLEGESLRAVPAKMLAQVGMGWNEGGEPGRTVAVLLPLFETGAKLDERYEWALDTLFNAMLETGQEQQRRQLIERMMAHPDKALSTTARCRLVSILSDQGQEDAAWTLFQEAQRQDPGNPQLWTLEMTLLVGQGRREEARLRAPLLVARARQAGLDDLAQVIADMGQSGELPTHPSWEDDEEDELDLQWLALVQALPQHIDLEVLHALYTVDVQPHEDEHGSAQLAQIRPTKKASELYRLWQRRFMVGKPNMVELQGDVDTLIASMPEALQFLQKNPQAWLCADVLDDVMLLAYSLSDEASPASVITASRKVAEHALAVLRALVDKAQVHWAEQACRPWLRCLAIAIELARVDMDEDASIALMRWGLALNPHDNHGWRSQLAPVLISRGEYASALALLACYPNDFPPSQHVQALALFALGRSQEAERLLRQAHQDYPLFVQSLLPEALDAPPFEESLGIRIGGLESAWQHRLEMRPDWVRTGAMDWLRQLKLPEAPAPRERQTAAPSPRGKSGRGVGLAVPEFASKHEKHLQKICGDYPRLHGFLMAIAWTPQLVMPNAWLASAMDLQDRMPHSRTEHTASKATNDALQATMALYNHLNAQVIAHQNERQAPLADVLAVVAGQAERAHAWAAGFVQGCEISLAAWARAGHKVTGVTGSFGRLRGLAACAPRHAGAGAVTDDEGRPHLQMAEHDPALPSLQQALQDLWPSAASARKV